MSVHAGCAVRDVLVFAELHSPMSISLRDCTARYVLTSCVFFSRNPALSSRRIQAHRDDLNLTARFFCKVESRVLFRCMELQDVLTTSPFRSLMVMPMDGEDSWLVGSSSMFEE